MGVSKTCTIERLVIEFDNSEGPPAERDQCQRGLGGFASRACPTTLAQRQLMRERSSDGPIPIH